MHCAPISKKHFPWFQFAAGLAALVALTMLYAYLAKGLPHNSDDTQCLLEANAIIHGNYMLHGWTLPIDNYTTLDLPFYVIGDLIYGFHFSLLYYVPAAIYALLVLVSMHLSAPHAPIRAEEHNQIRSRLLQAFLTFLYVGAIGTSGLGLTVLLGPQHIATLLASLLVIAIESRILAFSSQNASNNWFFLALLALSTLTFIGDPFSYIVLLAPSVTILALNAFQAHSRRSSIHVILVLIAALLFAHISLYAIRYTGGFVLATTVSTSLVSAQQFLPNIGAAAYLLTRLFGADIFGHIISSRASLITMVRLAAMCFAVWSITKVVQCTIRGDHLDHSSRVFAFSIIYLVLGSIFSHQFSIAIADPFHPDSAGRYLFPVVILSAILAGRQLGQIVINMDRGAAAIIIIGMTFFSAVALAYVAHSFRSEHPCKLSDRRLGVWLNRHHLNYGYGAYWDASIITAETGNLVRIRPVVYIGNRIVPFHWLSSANWYVSLHTPEFIVWDNSDWGAINKATVQHAYGKPERICAVDGRFIAVFVKTFRTVATNSTCRPD